MNYALSNIAKNLGKHPQLEEITTKVKQEFKEVYQDNLMGLVLFGSQARGDAKQNSDIDILVIVKEKKAQNNKHEKIINFISDLCLEYEILVSCVYVSEAQFKQEKSPLLLNIHKEGIFL